MLLQTIVNPAGFASRMKIQVIIYKLNITVFYYILENMEEKNIVVIGLGYLGDTILTEPLCRNIKNNLPDYRLIFIANKSFEDIPCGFESVDEVYGYDKMQENKGLIGILRFVKIFKYRNKVDFAIITHPHERSVLLAKIIGSRKIISLPPKRKLFNLNFLINRKVNYEEDEIRNTYKADYNLKYLEGLCKYERFPVKYKRYDIDYAKIISKFKLPETYIVLSPASKNKIKDWNFQDVKEFISLCPQCVVLVGGGCKTHNLSSELRGSALDYIDLTGKTTISELGAVIKCAKACVSVDTGTFHFSYAQEILTIGLFYNKQYREEWSPKNLSYVKTILGERHFKRDNKEIVETKNISAKDVVKILKDMYKKSH